jgi:hypothetical protein
MRTQIDTTDMVRIDSIRHAMGFGGLPTLKGENEAAGTVRGSVGKLINRKVVRNAIPLMTYFTNIL